MIGRSAGRLALRLAGTVLALGLPGLAVAQSPPPENQSWSVVVRASGFRYRPDLRVVAPRGSPRTSDAAIAASAVVEAQVAVVRTLSEGSPGPAATMLLVVPRATTLPATGDLTLIAEVIRDADGALWAGDAWMEVKGRLCLSPQRIAELGIGPAFARSTPGDKGERCIAI